MAVSSYGSATRTSGVVRIVKDLDLDLTDRHVLIVEDIVDSGLTLAYLRKNLKARNPASLEVCALLVKEGLQKTDPDLKYVGFRIPPDFVIGYGLDVAERYRNLPFIAEYAGPLESEPEPPAAARPFVADPRGGRPSSDAGVPVTSECASSSPRWPCWRSMAVVRRAPASCRRATAGRSSALTEFEEKLDAGEVTRGQAVRPLERAEGRARRRHEVRRPLPRRVHRRADDAHHRAGARAPGRIAADQRVGSDAARASSRSSS